MIFREIRILEAIPDDPLGLKVGEVIKDHEPYTGFNEDGTFTICYGMGLYFTLLPHQFEEICQEK